jgi:hypothetical protein
MLRKKLHLKITSDWNFTYQCESGICDLILNFCRQTISTCGGSNAIMWANIRGHGCRVLVSGNWDMVDVYQANYNNCKIY